MSDTLTLTYFLKYSVHVGLRSRMLNVCIHYGGRIITDRIHIFYWGGDEVKLPSIEVKCINLSFIEDWISTNLNEYNILEKLYYRVPGKQAVFSVDGGLMPIEKETDLQVLISAENNEHEIDLYVSHSFYGPIFYSPYTWFDREWMCDLRTWHAHIPMIEHEQSYIENTDDDNNSESGGVSSEHDVENNQQLLDFYWNTVRDNSSEEENDDIEQNFSYDNWYRERYGI